jgi:hypothetical protein
VGEVNREEIIRMALEAGAQGIVNRDFIDIEKFANLVAAAEREACARILDSNAEACKNNSMLADVLAGNALAIRARGEK